MKFVKKKIIVISGINIRKAGTLSIFYEFLDEIVEKGLYEKYDIRIMVSDEDLFKKYKNKVEILDFKAEKSSRLKRLYYEYFWMKKYSKNNDIFLWLSINDKTPSVIAKYRAVYCHNNTMFCNIKLKDFMKYRRMFVYSWLYPLLWKRNIKANDLVIVQQQRLADAFYREIGLKNICVMRPHSIINGNVMDFSEKDKVLTKHIFVYPTKCCVYKNIELICKASSIIKKAYKNQYIIYVTINKTNSAYAKSLVKKYSNDEHLVFCGFLSKNELQKMYNIADCLIFPSRLETWGLPMTEFASYNKSIIASDLPYAHETLLEYGKKAFVDPDSPENLAELMIQVINNVEFKYEKTENIVKKYNEIRSITDIIELAEKKP